ncbi:MAG: DUF3306 domain-containing protein [Rhodospirillaceae bacterium]|nr:DUF3306 domain-containing protein [Rhodospirillaceae bacterium]
MSDDGFLKRWSRRKRAGDEAPPPAPPAEPKPADSPPAHAAAVRAKSEQDADDVEIDPAILPSLESLGADSDYTVFLKKGVPEALRLAALRKAWVLDPEIRDFPSPAADYGWDFNTPEFALRSTDDVEAMVERILPGNPPAAPVVAVQENSDQHGEDLQPPAAPMEIQKSDVELPPEVSDDGIAPRRRHGGALPR